MCWWYWYVTLQSNEQLIVFFFFSSRRRHTRCREVSWARRCVQETGPDIGCRNAGTGHIENIRFRDRGNRSEDELSVCSKSEQCAKDHVACGAKTWIQYQNTHIMYMYYTCMSEQISPQV
eukprot:TRINITY_DN11403_c0_g1_i1.p3 TRINITY_DN11403_c0_g1~~TRINITY_DN11403_c0_g1_i1.p3  ORF type:complete len:120 (-),score=13.19 TRINITY_DN11403_c0_g1_i1:188-547(-)